MNRFWNSDMHGFALSRLTAGLLLMAMAAGAQAEVSQKTDTVKGRAPVANNVVISNQSYPAVVGARVGHVLRVEYGFTDVDGDAQSGSTIQWLRNGAVISGATASTYTVQSADGNSSLSVRVTPRTDPDKTDPESGVAVTSAALAATTGAVGYGKFLAPSTGVLGWRDADSQCRAKGARLPTEAELLALPRGNTMCSAYGWPLYGQCGGSTSHGGAYWSSTSPYSNYHKTVRLDNGNVSSLPSTASDNSAYRIHVACVR